MIPPSYSSILFPMFLIATSLGMATSRTLQGATLVVYDFSSDMNATSTDSALLTGATEVQYAGFESGSGGRSSGSTNAYVPLTAMGASLEEAASFSFTVTPSKALNLESLSFRYGFQNSRGGDEPYPAYNLTFHSTVTINGVKTDLSLDATRSSSGSIITSLPTTPKTYDLSQFSGVTSPITFTVYIYADADGVTQETARLDDFSVTGVAATAVPELTATSLLGLSGIALLTTRRRRA